MGDHAAQGRELLVKHAPADLGIRPPLWDRRTFLGRTAAALLAAAAGGSAIGSWAYGDSSTDRSSDKPDKADKADKDKKKDADKDKKEKAEKKPPERKMSAATKKVHTRVVHIIARHLKIEEDEIRSKSSLAVDLKVTTSLLVKIRKDIESEFKIEIPAAEFGKLATVGEVVDYVDDATRPPEKDNKRYTRPVARSNNVNRPRTLPALRGIPAR